VRRTPYLVEREEEHSPAAGALSGRCQVARHVTCEQAEQYLDASKTLYSRSLSFLDPEPLKEIVPTCFPRSQWSTFSRSFLEEVAKQDVEEKAVEGFSRLGEKAIADVAAKRPKCKVRKMPTSRFSSAR